MESAGIARLWRKNAMKQNSQFEAYINPASPQTESVTQNMEEDDALEMRREVADYVERMTADLCVMATRVDLNFLAYLLDMARIEASDRGADETISETVHIG